MEQNQRRATKTWHKTFKEDLAEKEINWIKLINKMLYSSPDGIRSELLEGRQVGPGSSQAHECLVEVVGNSCTSPHRWVIGTDDEGKAFSHERCGRVVAQIIHQHEYL